MNTQNRFASPKKPQSEGKELLESKPSTEPVDEWKKIELLKMKKMPKTEQEILKEVQEYEEHLDISSLSDSDEKPFPKINSVSREDVSCTAHLNKIIPLEPFNLRDEIDCNLIDSNGNFLIKNFNNSYNDAWLMSLDENISDPLILKDRKKTFEYVIKKKMSEDSSLKSVDEKDTTESLKDKKLETIKSALLDLLINGESPNQAIHRYRKLLPSKNLLVPYKKNKRTLTTGK